MSAQQNNPTDGCINQTLIEVNSRPNKSLCTFTNSQTENEYKESSLDPKEIFQTIENNLSNIIQPKEAISDKSCNDKIDIFSGYTK